MRILSSMFVLMIARASLLVAQGSEADAPSRVAAELLTAHRTQDWRQLQRSAHPAAFEDFQAAQLKVVSREVSPVRPDAPGRRERLTRLRRTSQFVLDSIYGVKTASALRGLAAETVFVRYHTKLERVIRASPGFARSSHRIIGELLADSIAYVVVETRRDTVGAEPDVTLGVTSFRRASGRWLSMLDGPLALTELIYHVAWHDD